jgi:hypothetical protein
LLPSLILAACVLLLGGTAAVVLYSSGIARLRRRRVVVHTKDEYSIKGVLAATYRDCLVIAEPEYLDAAQPANLKGRVVVPRANIAFLQVVED